MAVEANHTVVIMVNGISCILQHSIRVQKSIFCHEASSHVHSRGCSLRCPVGNSKLAGPNRGGSAGRVDATRGSKHRGLKHAREKRKHARFVAIAPNSDV
jgi:hypothetical protein